MCLLSFQSKYLDLIAAAEFTNIYIQKEKRIDVPEQIIRSYLTKEALGIYSITVSAVKPKLN